MNFRTITPDSSISLFVKDILLFEDARESGKTALPFFADGYPGLLFQQTPNGLRVHPHGKQMPPLFLYGQTLHPVELEMLGSYRVIVFQLYPYVLKRFFGIQPQTINDDCYDLGTLFPDTAGLLQHETDADKQVDLLRELLLSLFLAQKDRLDQHVRRAIQLILHNKGQIAMKDVAETLCLTNRTFERRFTAETGITPKQFAQIIQFQLSLEQLTVRDYTTLSDVVYANGFADQSHFIRVFKAYTGVTPGRF